MKIVLITCPIEKHVINMNINWEYSPVGLLTLASILNNSGNDTVIFDVNKRANEIHLTFDCEDTFDTLAKELAEYNADVYGFSTICDGYEYTLLLAKKVKELSGRTIMFGGPQASICDTDTLESFSFVDFIIRGEAESCILQIVEYLQDKVPIDIVKGITYRKNGFIVRNQNGEIVEDLEGLPFINAITKEKHKDSVCSIEAGRGCPFSCSFCGTSRYFKRKFRLKSDDRIIAEIINNKEEYEVNNFSITHDLFTFDKCYTERICKKLIEKGLGINWTCSARLDILDEEIIELMHKSGCNSIFFGLESASARVQKIINKNINIGKSIRNIKFAVSKGIFVSVSLIIGFPFETYEDILTTLKCHNELLMMGVKDVILNILMPFKGTELYDNYDLAGYSVTYYQGKRKKTTTLKQINEWIQRYPNIFFAHYLMEPQFVSFNSIIYLSIIVSSMNFKLSNYMLVGMRDFDYIQMVKAFDCLNRDAQADEYEDYYVQYLDEKSRTNADLLKVCELAKYERDFIRFSRSVLSEGQRSIYISAHKYRFDIGYIKNSIKMNTHGVSQVMLNNIQMQDSYYLFFYSPKYEAPCSYLISRVLYDTIQKHFHGGGTEYDSWELIINSFQRIPILNEMKVESDKLAYL